MAKIRRFLHKVKGFVKRNAYALAVCFCVLMVFSVITAVSVADLYKVEKPETQTQQEQPDDAKPTSSETVIVFEAPVKNGTISKEYAEDYVLEDKTSGVWKTHQAIDYAGSEGTKTLAVYDGTVESVETTLMDGTVVTIKHTDTLKSVYKSLGSTSLKAGDGVKTGDEVGVMGTSTSEKAEGTHLHFEVMRDGKLVDPNNYLSAQK